MKKIPIIRTEEIGHDRAKSEGCFLPEGQEYKIVVETVILGFMDYMNTERKQDEVFRIVKKLFNLK